MNELFIWVSGILLLIYCDNCFMLFFLEVRNDVVLGISKFVEEYFFEIEMIVGIVIVGIFYVVLVVDCLNFLMCYVRSKLKVYGKGN